MEQMKKFICKIHIRGTKGTGFFLKMPYRKELIKVLVTSNHILGENDIYDDKFIFISINNETSFKKIKLIQKEKYI